LNVTSSVPSLSKCNKIVGGWSFAKLAKHDSWIKGLLLKGRGRTGREYMGIGGKER